MNMLGSSSLKCYVCIISYFKVKLGRNKIQYAYCCIKTALGEGCIEWPTVESRVITYRINNGVLEATVRCRHGFQLRPNNSVQDQHLQQVQQLTVRCLSNVWDAKPPHCVGKLHYIRVI